MNLFKTLVIASLATAFTLTGSANAALAIIAHPSNRAAGITDDEAAQIYLGKSGELAGQHVVPVDQSLRSVARTQFYRSVVKKTNTELKTYWSKLIFSGKGQPPREIGDDAAVHDYVAANPDAIGYVDGKFVDKDVKVLLILP